MQRQAFLAVSAAIAISVYASAHATIIYVDDTATGTGDGSWWGDAHTNLQDALAEASSGDEIRVAQGIYFPHNTDHTVSFELVNGVLLKGGFRGGTGSDPDEYAPSKFPTILSGDIDHDDSNGCALDDDTNSVHVVKAVNVGSGTVLQGFQIVRGNAGFGDGGGLQIVGMGSTLQVLDCEFHCNRAASGGAVDHGGSQSEYFNCVFHDNVAAAFGGAIFAYGGILDIAQSSFWSNSAPLGGALEISEVASAEITDCTFTNHENADYGGAIHNQNSIDTRIVDCSFSSNTASFNGGAIYHLQGEDLSIIDSEFDANASTFGSGGAVLYSGTDAIFRNCSFSSNIADQENGGALYVVADDSIVVACDFDGNEAYSGGAIYASCTVFTSVNTRFFSNSAFADGGAITFSGTTLDALNSLLAKNQADNGGAIYSSGSISILVNCTVADNGATSLHGGIYSVGNATIRNSILWGNEAPTGSTVEQQIAVGGSATLTATYCDVMGGIGGATNKNVDPWFADPDGYNYRLRLCSACLDSADFDQVDDDVHDVDGDPANNGDATPDLDLHIRAVDRPNIADTGVGTHTFTDMGAFENCIGDANGDQKVNGLDIQPFVNCLLDNPAESDVCDCADSTLDGELTLDDVPCFVSVLLGVTDGCYTCAEGGLERGIADCNENEVPDANDIAEGTSQDCNGNFIPDECDIAAETSVDVDENGVPDECQTDCNGNDVPDEKDIADEESLDCNENGIPDECERDCNSNGVPDDCDLDPEDPDGDEWVSPDCNTNGVPDECEDDCNENGVPDDCDVDPEDPDGDEWVSPDCNENGYPDECDLTLPPGLGSYDCNENEIPDECDIAEETSCDANANDVPDECDILLEECVDANEDECCDEEESLMGGGESMMSSSSEGPCAELTEAECWAVFHDWAMQQCWGPQCESTGFEQFQSARAKLAELGLLFGNPES
ncbi:hypothetical protein RAS2_16620 [Phycisphaerae bacterium RAS2]|nr:hypothetical protein RAS2_16620 [Phycisphaerae bacterium RAS2]